MRVELNSCNDSIKKKALNKKRNWSASNDKCTKLFPHSIFLLDEDDLK